jgi:DNA-directed RNA polymerase beta' subunit
VPADFNKGGEGGFRSNLLSRLVDTSARTALR